MGTEAIDALLGSESGLRPTPGVVIRGMRGEASGVGYDLLFPGFLCTRVTWVSKRNN